MGAMKDLFSTMQQEFAEYKFIKDGCPEGEAAKEDWESMVKSFFDGDNAAALEEFQVWCGGELPARFKADLCVPDTPDNHREHDLQNARDRSEEISNRIVNGLARQAREEAETGLPWDPTEEGK